MSSYSPENFSYFGRIQNFLQFKGIIPSEEFLAKFSGDSVKILRDIEEQFPYPIGFIGPIEPIFQWSTMILTSYSELNTQILESVFEEIEEKVEDEYFVMGPTFSVADCVLASDLKQVEKNFLLPEGIKEYIIRVEQFLNQS